MDDLMHWVNVVVQVRVAQAGGSRMKYVILKLLIASPPEAIRAQLQEALDLEERGFWPKEV